MTWADVNYQHKKKITIDVSKVKGAETDFPVVVDITDSDLMDCLANGHDIKFYDSTETNQLKHERVQWNKATGRLIAWVKIPSLSGVANTEFYMYYEYSGELVDQQDQNGTWDSDFYSVLHMNQSSGDILDSTSNGHDFTPGGGDGHQGTGKIGYGYAFNGSTRYLYNDAMDWKILTASTVEFFFATGSASGGSGYLFFGSWWGGSEDIRLNMPKATPTSLQYIYDDGIIIGGGGPGHVLTLWQYYHFVTTHTNAGGGCLKGFYNGDSELTDTTSANFDYANMQNRHRIGCRFLGASNTLFFYGNMDEFRISKIDRSENWIGTSYNAQDNPSSFLSFDAEESQVSTYDFNFPIKGVINKKYKYKIKDTEQQKYDAIQKNRYKYKRQE